MCVYIATHKAVSAVYITFILCLLEWDFSLQTVGVQFGSQTFPVWAGRENAESVWEPNWWGRASLMSAAKPWITLVQQGNPRKR